MKIDSLIQNIQENIKNFDISISTEEYGNILSITDGIARVSGLPGCQSNEMLSFPNGIFGIALNLEEDSIGVIILGDYTSLKEGDQVLRTKRILSVPVSMDLVGRVVNPIGETVDGGKTVITKDYYPVEKTAPGVMDRQGVDQPVQTGILAIDAMIPIGRGQRELIIGDRQTGKSAVAIDTIINQKGQNMLCVYVAIGQKQSKIARTIEILRKSGAMEYTTIVAAGAAEGPAYSYLAPYVGVAIAEYYMDKGNDVLIVYDDLSKHAVAYREISLLLRRPPGREAYPGDVFYLHSRLLERACRRNPEAGGGSITALPIIETQAGDISAYVPTNVISITDGQIFLESGLFYKGIRPAINVGLSVSRVGSSAQTKPMKKTAGKLKLAMAQYRELESFAQFDSDLDPETKKQLNRGKRITELLKQVQYAPMPVGEQVATIFAANNGFFDSFDVLSIKEKQEAFLNYMRNSYGTLLKDLEKTWNDEIESSLSMALKDATEIIL